MQKMEYILTFEWENSQQKAKLISKKENKYVRYKWLDSENDETFFQIKIEKLEITGDVAVQIIDFAPKGETDSIVELWDEQIEQLKHNLGV